MARGDQLPGITSVAERVLPVESVVNFTENGPFNGPPIMHQFAPHKCVISIHSADVACQMRVPLSFTQCQIRYAHLHFGSLGETQFGVVLI